MDNSIMTQSYQSFKQNLGSYNFPSLGGMINFGVNDLMEDHKIIGGFVFRLILEDLKRM